MKAAIWYGRKDIRIEDKPIPEIKDNEVLIKVKAVSMSFLPGKCSAVSFHSTHGGSKELANAGLRRKLSAILDFNLEIV